MRLQLLHKNNYLFSRLFSSSEDRINEVCLFHSLVIVIPRVVVALCGGNIDTTALGRVIERGLAADGRLVRFVVTVTDRPGGIAELTRIIADKGVR